MELHIKKELSIQISLSGFSFCILNRTTSEIEFLERTDFKSKLNPESVLDQLKIAISKNPQLTDSFDTILVLFQNELSNLVPEYFFEEKNAADYLKFSNKIMHTDFISYDKIEANNSINVFVPYMNINNYLFELYGEFEYRHASTVYIEQILKDADDPESDKLYINVASSQFELAVVSGSKLQLFNTYEYFTTEDFIYFILFTMEQLKLNPEKVLIKISGEIVKDDDFYQMLYTYIRHVEFYEPPSRFTHKNADIGLLHQHSIILNSFN